MSLKDPFIFLWVAGRRKVGLRDRRGVLGVGDYEGKEKHIGDTTHERRMRVKNRYIVQNAINKQISK